MKILSFSHPEPERDKKTIVPFFIPFLGCPGKCVYCAQNLQTGTKIKTIEETFEDFKKLLSALKNRTKPVELAFYGGTFTGLSKKWIEKFLNLALPLKQQGIISRIRCSTRPDYVDHEILATIKKLGIDLVEFGIQSFDNFILRVSGRGYNQETALKACYLTKETGLDLGIQLLPGLPGFTSEIWMNDIKQTIKLEPAMVRIYPCIVLKGTVLEKKFLKKDYVPLDLHGSIKLIARGVVRLWRNNIPVIRIGLHNEVSLEKNVVAGPWSAAYGSMVRSYILYEIIFTYFILTNRSIKKIYIPKKYQGELFGYKKMYKDKYKKMGLNPENIILQDTTRFKIEY